jgi:hypothetical protein
MTTDEVVKIRLDWRTLCAVACRAVCLGVSFDDVCNMAIQHEMTKVGDGS